MSRTFQTLLPVTPIALAVVFAMSSTPRRAAAEPATVDAAEKAEKCATRLFTAMVGEGATAEALASTNPQSFFDTLVKDARFQERFSRFINSEFNPRPGANQSEDASYFLAKHVLTQDKPWSEMFVGKYDVAPADTTKPNDPAVVKDDPNGLGYFKSRAWMVRYAGNEPSGIRIVAAYRMMQNTIGLQLSATTNAPEVDVSATGRQAPQCASCHYDPWFALDKVAAVFGKKTGNGNNIQFQESVLGPQTILGGVSISNEDELAAALVANEAFNVNACRLAYKYLFGRIENSCEGPVFDACVNAFKADKKITSALAVVAKDPTFCE